VEEGPPTIARTDPRSPGDLTPVVLDCEYALLGVVLRADRVEQAAWVLAAVIDDDVADPWIRDALALARVVVGEGLLPAPSVLLARLTTNEGTHRYRRMALLFVDAWWAGPPPIAAWPLVVAVLEASYRRAARRWATRVRQACDGPLDVLVQILGDSTEVRTAWRRLTAARRGITRIRNTTADTSRDGRHRSFPPAQRARPA
jgi:hypothetical protein